MDNKVIDGHVIPNNVIFTAAAQMEVPQTTAAFEDNLKVTVSFFKQKDGKSKSIYGNYILHMHTYLQVYIYVLY